VAIERKQEQIKNNIRKITVSKNRHINKYLSDKLPDPEIPADDAWENMNDMLNSAGSPKSPGEKVLANLKWPLLSIIGIAISALMVFKFAFEQNPSNEKRNPKQTELSHPKPQNGEQHGVRSKGSASLSIKENALNNLGKRILDKDLDYRKVKNPDTSANGNKPEKILVKNTKNNTQPVEPDQVAAQPAIARNNTHIFSDKTAGPNSFANNSNSSPLRRSRKKEEANYKSQRDNSNIPIRSESNAMQLYPLGAAPVGSGRDTRNTFEVWPLVALKGQHGNSLPNLGNKINVPVSNAVNPRSSKNEKTFHVGLEWNLTSPFKKTDYLFAGKDSVNKPANLLIPALVITKNWRAHQLTFSAAARQSYFGNQKTIVQVADSTFGDSSLLYYNYKYNLIKATGLNFSLQYHYHFARAFALGAGASYTVFSNALLRQTTQNWADKVWDGPIVRLQDKGQISEYSKPWQIAIKAGLLYDPGRFQMGFNVILPVSEISRSSGFSIKEPNGQVFVRFMFW
jgi:hypothetical protein